MQKKEKKRFKGKCSVKKLLEVMENIIRGDYNELKNPKFCDSEYGTKLCELLKALKKGNNSYSLELNEAMSYVGNNALIKDTFEKVKSQTKMIERMEASSESMKISINDIADFMGTIRNNTQGILKSFKNLTNNMDSNIQTVNIATAEINEINEKAIILRKNINKIEEITKKIKKLASQSTIIAINASVEAARAGANGKSFDVVARDMHQFSTDIELSAEDISNYTEQINKEIQLLALSVNTTSERLNEGKAKVEVSLKEIKDTNENIADIGQSVENIFNSIDSQNNAVTNFSTQMSELSKGYALLSKDCINLGTYIFKFGRYIDKTRNDMVKKNSIITDIDWLHVFDVDHFVLMWRIYNNIVGFEHLNYKQVNDSKSCKLGKWILSQTNPQITSSEEFMQLNDTHELFHYYASKSWTAKERDDDSLAEKYFNTAYQCYFKFKKAVSNMLDKMVSLGFTEKTAVRAFEGK